MIKIDMDLPNSCDVCDFNSNGYPRQYCEFPRCGFDVTDYIASRDIDCPLIEIVEEINQNTLIQNSDSCLNCEEE